MPRSVEINKDTLIDLYVQRKMTIKEVCIELHVKSHITVMKYMKKYGILSRNTNQERSLLSTHNLELPEFKEILFKKYNNEGKSINEISKEYKVSPVIIKRYLDKFAIPTRNHKDANRVNNTGSNNHRWIGGKRHKDGYVLITMPDHPNANQGYIYEHRAVMEKHIGRYLTKEELVHHKNENKKDNRIENLEILTNSQHAKLHAITKVPHMNKIRLDKMKKSV